MLSVRFILSFLLLANGLHAKDLSFSVEKHHEIEQPVAAWTDQYLTQMSPSQLQLTANFVYLLYACASLEYAVRMPIPAIINQIQQIEQKLKSNNPALKELATVQALISQLKHTSYARQLMYETFAQAQKYLDDNKNTHEFQPVNNALEFLQLHGQHTLCLHADTHEEKLNNDIAELGNAFDALKQFLPIAADMCKGLQDNTLSFDVEPENKNVAKIDTASHLCVRTTQQSWYTIDSANRLYNHLIQLTHVGENVYAAYYHAIYHFLHTHHIDKHYQSVMFCPQGLLISKFRTKLLASPEQITKNITTLDHIHDHHIERYSNA